MRHHIKLNSTVANKMLLIRHINDVTKPHRTLTFLFSFKKYFIRIVKLYICFVLVNIRNIFVLVNIRNIMNLTYPF